MTVTSNFEDLRRVHGLGCLALPLASLLLELAEGHVLRSHAIGDREISLSTLSSQGEDPNAAQQRHLEYDALRNKNA